MKILSYELNQNTIKYGLAAIGFVGALAFGIATPVGGHHDTAINEQKPLTQQESEYLGKSLIDSLCPYQVSQNSELINSKTGHRMRLVTTKDGVVIAKSEKHDYKLEDLITQQCGER